LTSLLPFIKDCGPIPPPVFLVPFQTIRKPGDQGRDCLPFSLAQNCSPILLLLYSWFPFELLGSQEARKRIDFLLPFIRILCCLSSWIPVFLVSLWQDCRKARFGLAHQRREAFQLLGRQETRKRIDFPASLYQGLRPYPPSCIPGSLIIRLQVSSTLGYPLETARSHSPLFALAPNSSSRIGSRSCGKSV